LSKFIALFKHVDADRDGIIDEMGFRELLDQMAILNMDAEVELILAQIDPNNNQKMTFSQIVHTLSNSMVPKSED
jgi:Ca2+-binding EF-hand superfamily protein